MAIPATSGTGAIPTVLQLLAAAAPLQLLVVLVSLLPVPLPLPLLLPLPLPLPLLLLPPHPQPPPMRRTPLLELRWPPLHRPPLLWLWPSLLLRLRASMKTCSVARENARSSTLAASTRTTLHATMRTCDHATMRVRVRKEGVSGAV
jgi:hypothetical protein